MSVNIPVMVLACMADTKKGKGREDFELVQSAWRKPLPLCSVHVLYVCPISSFSLPFSVACHTGYIDALLSSLGICHSAVITTFFSEHNTTKKTNRKKTDCQANPQGCEFILKISRVA